MPFGIVRHCGVEVIQPASAGLPMAMTKLYQEAREIAGDELDLNYPSLLAAPFLRSASEIIKDGIEPLLNEILAKDIGMNELIAKQLGSIDMANADRACIAAVDYLEPEVESLWSQNSTTSLLLGACCTYFLMTNRAVSLLNENIIDLEDAIKSCPAYSGGGIEGSLKALRLVQMMVLLAGLKESGE